VGLVAAVHSYANCATPERRALIHELEVVAFALFLCRRASAEQNQIWRVFSRSSKRNNRSVTARSLASSEYERDER